MAEPAPLSPALLEVWRKCATSTVSLSFPTKQTAARIRFQLYNMRKRLQRENHELYPLIADTTITIQLDPKTTNYLLVLISTEAVLEKALTSAGFATTKLPTLE